MTDRFMGVVFIVLALPLLIAGPVLLIAGASLSGALALWTGLMIAANGALQIRKDDRW
jgi:hypothetical protein